MNCCMRAMAVVAVSLAAAWGTSAQAQCIEPYDEAMEMPPESAPTLELSEQFAALTGPTFAGAAPGGYIDNAIPMTQFRFRFDAAYDNPTPDRTEFFYPKCGCFRGIMGSAAFDPNAPGPPLPETGVDYQEYRMYLEVAPWQNASAFVELPFREINPVVNNNTGGLGDLIAGFKAVLWSNPCKQHYLTFQMKVYTPTGDGDRGLGTDHASIEPGLLYTVRTDSGFTIFSELRHWVPLSDSIEVVTGDEWDGDVLRYGIGIGYDVINRCDTRLTPVIEFVGWSIFDGFTTDLNAPNAARDVAGDTIVNAKFGARYTTGPNSFYAGYGTALTSDVWYEDILRLEYRRAF